MSLIVLAPNLRQAEWWARQHGLNHREWRYVADAAQLTGLGDCTCVVVNGPGSPAVETELRVLAATSRVRVQREFT